MPSQKPRINLTLDNELKDVLSDLSELMGKPQATIITDFLIEMYPALVGLRDALIDVRDKKNAVPHLAKMASYINEQAGVINGGMAEIYAKESEK